MHAYTFSDGVFRLVRATTGESSAAFHAQGPEQLAVGGPSHLESTIRKLARALFLLQVAAGYRKMHAYTFSGGDFRLGRATMGESRGAFETQGPKQLAVGPSPHPHFFCKHALAQARK